MAQVLFHWPVEAQISRRSIHMCCLFLVPSFDSRNLCVVEKGRYRNLLNITNNWCYRVDVKHLNQLGDKN